MTRARKICSTPGCPQLQPCTEHQRKPWAKSSRRDHLKLKSGSAQQRRARHVLLKHDGLCHVCGHAGADQADHVVPLSEGGADDLSNLRPIHAEPCHREKTAAEAQRARAAR